MALDITDKLGCFSQISQTRLTNLLSSMGGPKDLVIDGSLMKPLERFIGVKTLRSHGVEKIFKLDKKEVATTTNNKVFLVRGDLITVKRVCDQINSDLSGQHCHLITFPAAFHSIKVLIEEEGLYGRVSLHPFNWELISVDTRVFSFECPDVFKTTFVAKDSTFLMPCARTLWTLQQVLGKIPFKVHIGPHSKAINSMVKLLDESYGEPDSVDSDVGLLLVVDRNVDYVSTLLTPGTYTSLIAEVVGINAGVVQITKNGQATTVLLSSDDETYNTIKHKHFSEVLVYLKQKINQFYTEQAKRNNMTVQEMRAFVQNDLGKVATVGKILSNHLTLCEKVTNKIGKIFEGLQSCQHDILTEVARKEAITFIEDIIATGEDMNVALRLICLLSVCQNGLTQQEANSLKMQFLHAFGHEHITTFYNLEKMGLIISAAPDVPTKLASKVVHAVGMPRKSSFQVTAAKLKLFPDTSKDYSLTNPQDMSYVFGGIYIPIIAQVVNSILKKEKTLRELFKYLPSDMADVSVEGRSLDETPDIRPQCVWVYVVGGITYAEIAAFAFLEKRTGCRIICSGSNIINGNLLIQSAI